MPVSLGRPVSRLQRLDLIIHFASHSFKLCFTQSVMPHRPWEESAQDSEPEKPATPTKPSRNDGATRADPDAEDPAAQSDEEEGLGPKKIRPPRHVLKYEVV